jgi:ABC-type antimicrobial peptide transport system permease subunit
MKFALTCGTLMLCFVSASCFGQEQGGTTDKIINFPTKLFSRIQGKTASLDQQLTRQTENYLQKMAKREATLKKKLFKVDSAAAKRLFASSAGQYAALEHTMATDTGGHAAIPLTGEYQPYTDSLKGSLSFLQQNPQLTKGAQSQALQSSITQLQQLQAKMQDADAAKAFIQQRKQEIGNYISQHANLQTLLGSQYQGFNQQVYYYSQQVREYKEMLNHPDQLEHKALSLLDKIQAIWHKNLPATPFDYAFLDDEMQKQYETEITTSHIINSFTLMAIFISCLGLFGLAAFSADQRSKEIGIRKVLGAGILGIVQLLSGDFLKLVMIAFLIATPISWWAMHQWLQGFAYRVEIQWWMFTLAGLMAMFIALFTVSFQAIKAAMVNPVKSLRAE